MPESLVASLASAWWGGLAALEKYFFGKILGAFVPAFFLAGAIGTWIPRSAVTRYLSASARRSVAYPVATIAGGVVSVCACGILPLFAAIYSRGAGVGPAMTFLFAGPAINLIAIYYTFDLLGTGLGWARILTVALGSIAIGLAFELFVGEPRDGVAKAGASAGVDLSDGTEREAWQTAFPMVFMALATLVLPMSFEPTGRALVQDFAGGMTTGFLGGITGAVRAGLVVKWLLVLVCWSAVVWSTRRWFSPEERTAWLDKTWFLLKQIVPKIVLGIFLTGVAEALLDRSAVIDQVGTNEVLPTFVAALVGGILYFGTILGVVTARLFQTLGMADGPLLALLLAGPTVTLPSVFAISGILGARRATAYFVLVVAYATAAGLVYGRWAGG